MSEGDVDAWADAAWSARVGAFLATQSTLTLATVGAGAPLAAPLFFAADEALTLYFVSGARSAHAQALAREPRAAVAVYASGAWDWRALQGVQARGRVVALTDVTREVALVCYAAKFPFVAEFAERIAASVVYAFVPEWARWIDNTQGFAHKDARRITAGA